MGKVVKQKTVKKDIKIWPAIICLILATMMFLFLLSVESRQLANYEKGLAVVAVSEVAENVEITESNVSTYFALKERPLSDIPESAYVNLNDLVGQYVIGGIDNGSIVTERMIGSLDFFQEGMVLVGVNMEALEQSVVGTIRTGDCIDIYTVMVNEEEEVFVEKVLDGIFVDRSYNSSGVSIVKEDVTSVAQYITVPLHKDAVEPFYRALEDKRIEIVKHQN